MISTFAALKYRNYRLWFSGQLVSLVGTWMQSTALGFLVFELTKSPAQLGYVAFAAGLPSWLFMLYAGVIADRIPRRTLLIVTQSFMALLAALLSILTLSNLIEPWHIILLSFASGIPAAFDAPARQSFAVELVEKEDLTNAIALNSMLFNSSMIIGPALGGIVYALWGPGWCFALNSLSFLFIIVNLILMNTRKESVERKGTSAIAEIMEGFRYIYAEKLILIIMIIIIFLTIFGMSFMTLIPAWVVKVLSGDSRTAGFLQSARGIGAVGVALFIATLGRFSYRGKLLSIGTIVLPLLLFLFAFIHSIPLSLIVMFFIGAALILVMNLANAIVQTLVDDHLRGRVMSVYTLTFFGFMPVGGLLVGFLAEHFGETETVMMCSTVMLVVAIVIQLFAPKLRKQ